MVHRSTKNPLNANSAIGYKGAIAHEVVGHYEAWLKGFENENKAIDEAQASIRAARFAPGVPLKDRHLLIRDALTRLKNAGISLKDARPLMKIEER